MLYYLIYCSIAVELMTEEDLRVLLKQARTNNRELVITGMLVYVEGKYGMRRQGRFMQVLEGSRFLIESVFDKIKRDSRHRELVVLKRDAIHKRNFKTWEMGFERIDLDKHPELFPFFEISEGAVNEDFMDSNAALAFLKSFYDEQRDKDVSALK
jgi:hypothetical protein